MREDGALTRWLDTAVSGIRFKPDRAAVRAELEGHLEDKMADLRRIFPDIPDLEARDRALEGMGDPAAVRRELARVHRPWLGYLWYACRGVLAAAVLAALLFAGLPALMGENDSYSRDWYWSVRPEGWVPPAPAAAGDYTLEVVQAARWEEHFHRTDGTGEEVWSCESAAFRLRVSAPWPWDRPPGRIDSLEQYLRGTDSGGRTFSFVCQPGNDDPFYDQPVEPGGAGLCWREYLLYCQDITPGAAWMALEYDFGGRAFSIRADIPERVTFVRGKTVTDIRGEEGTAWETESSGALPAWSGG